MLNQLCTWTAKLVPYLPCTVTNFWPASWRVPRPCPVQRQVTPTNFIAGSLGGVALKVLVDEQDYRLATGHDSPIFVSGWQAGLSWQNSLDE